ncbi:MAG: hypothetical protein PVJ27_06805, partial [Candidatus Brocadiaceae bacterium]
MKRNRLFFFAVLVLIAGGVGVPRQAAAVPILPPDLADLASIINHTRPWLFIGTGAPNDSTTPEGMFNKGVGDAVDISNFEIGANKAPVPATSAYGPGLAYKSNIPYVPGVDIDVGPDGMTGVPPLAQVICYDGNVAVTHIDTDDPTGDDNGRFSVSDVGVFAKHFSEGGKIPESLPTGIVTAGIASDLLSSGGTIQNNSNSFFNDVDYPNSIGDPTKNPGDPAKKLAPGNGITGDFDFAYLRSALDDALYGTGSFVGIPALPGAA